MKGKSIIGIALTLLSAGSAGATVYLVKEGRVVASFSDNEVDCITFEDPTQYDFVTENVLMQTTYYSDAMQSEGYNYYMFFSDRNYTDNGLPMDATVFSLRVCAPEPAKGESLRAPAGTYRLGSDEMMEWTIRRDVSSVAQKATSYQLSDAVLTIVYEDGTDIADVTIKATDENGITYSSTFKGVSQFDDQSIKWYGKDIDMSGGNLTATFLKQDTGFDMNCNMNIMIAENGYDEGGWLVTPGNLITFVGNVELDSQGHFVPATWTIMEGDVAEHNTLLAGKCVNLMGVAFPVNTNLKHYNNDTDIEVGLVKSGSAKIAEIEPGMYRLTYDFVTNTGNRLTGTYTGRIEVKNFIPQELWHLDSDYTLSMQDATARCYQYSDQVMLDIVEFDENWQYLGDRMDLRFVPKGDFGPGVYKIEDDDTCKGTIVPGSFFGTWGTESTFTKYSDDGSGTILKGSGIKGGQVEIVDNGDDTWTVKYDLLDDQEAPHKITGSWTGKVTIE